MATTIKQSFSEFTSNLEIRDRQTALVSERRKNVVDAIAKKLALHSTSPSKLIGAYDRNTLIRYLSEGDVDVMVILHYGQNKSWDCAEGTVKALDKFKEILDEAYPTTNKRRDRNCISMSFSEFKLDVVPGFEFEGGYYQIPDSVRKNWVPTDPFKFAEKITEVNKLMAGTFVPLIKMVKAWNRECKFILRSFHIECMMYNHFRYFSTGYDYPWMLQNFFAALPGHLLTAVYDPVMGDRVDTYLDNDALITDRSIAYEKAKKAAAKSKEAYEDQEKYPSVAIGEWKEVLGEFFPTYG